MPAHALFQNTKELIGNFFETFDPAIINELVAKLHGSNGLIFFTGVGKSGLIAQKIAVTMTSTGTRALFLSPTDSLHGDIGLVGKGDFVFLLSKSGESDELLSMIPFLRNREAVLVAVVCNPLSRLAQAAHHVAFLPLKQELCPHDLTPTISTTSQLMFGDLLSICLMKAKNFSASDFAQNHPAGKIGKRALMRVRDLMIKGDQIPLAGAGDKLIDTLVELTNKRAGCVLIQDGIGRLLGIFMDGDLRCALQNRGAAILDLPLQEFMSPNPKKIDPDVLLVDALKIMEADQQHPIMVLPAVDNEGRIGKDSLNCMILSKQEFNDGILAGQRGFREVKRKVPFGLLYGVTTNPELLKGCANLEEAFRAILETFEEGPLAVQVMHGTAEDMIDQGKILNDFSERIIVKIPVTEEGLKAIHGLATVPIYTMTTCVFTPQQALLVAQAGADYVALFLGRLEKSGGSPGDLLRASHQIFQNYHFETCLLAASLQDLKQVEECAEIGIDAVTLRPELFDQLLHNHPLTEETLKRLEGSYKAQDASLFRPRRLI